MGSAVLVVFVVRVFTSVESWFSSWSRRLAICAFEPSTCCLGIMGGLGCLGSFCVNFRIQLATRFWQLLLDMAPCVLKVWISELISCCNSDRSFKKEASL